MPSNRHPYRDRQHSSTSYSAEDRVVRGAAAGTTQRNMGFNNNSLNNAQTHQFIDYTART